MDVKSIKKQITIDFLIDFLNHLLEIDRQAITGLFLERKVLCNELLANHDSVQVGLLKTDPKSKDNKLYNIGILGILNGLFGIYPDNETEYPPGHGQIAAVIDEKSLAILKFEKTQK